MRADDVRPVACQAAGRVALRDRELRRACEPAHGHGHGHRSRGTGDPVVADDTGESCEQLPGRTVAELLQTLPAGGEDAVGSLAAVLQPARASCPSCVAVSLTVEHVGVLVTVVASVATGPRYAASMTVRLPRASPERPARRPAVLVVFATDALALARLTVDIAALLGISRRDVTLAASVLVPRPTAAGLVLAGQLADGAAVDRALGALLDQGWPPNAGRTELQRRADTAGTSLARAAAAVLAALPDPSPR